MALRGRPAKNQAVGDTCHDPDFHDFLAYMYMLVLASNEDMQKKKIERGNHT